MTKVRKLKRKKKFRVNVNRKRLGSKLRATPKIECTAIKKEWDHGKSTKTNLNAMGLAYDPNEALEIPNIKHERIKDAKVKVFMSDLESEEEPAVVVPPKIHVAEELEAFAKAPRERRFQLPKGQVQFITYLMDKYGDDYKAMARDRKNYDQLTWKQVRAKVKTFMGIPEQYNKYIQSKSS